MLQADGDGGAAAASGWVWQGEGALSVRGGCCHTCCKTPNFCGTWPCERCIGEAVWLTPWNACNISWKRVRFWRNTDIWPPICAAACRQNTSGGSCEVQCPVPMWSSPEKSWSSSGADSRCPGWWSLFLDWHTSNLILFFSRICWVLGIYAKNVLKKRAAKLLLFLLHYLGLGCFNGYLLRNINHFMLS